MQFGQQKCQWNLVPSLIFFCEPSQASFCLFSSFSNKHYSFLQQINVPKSPSLVWGWDLNQRPSDHESPPVTTKPGLPPASFVIWFLMSTDGLTSFAGDSRLIDGLNATAEIFSTFPTEGISQGIGFLDQVKLVKSVLVLLFTCPRYSVTRWQYYFFTFGHL